MNRFCYYFLTTLLCTQLNSAYAVEPYWLKRIDHSLSQQNYLQDGELLVNQSRFAEAYQLLAPHTLKQANNGQFLYLLGTSAYGLQKYHEAKRLLTRAERLSPKSAEIQLMLGLTLLSFKKTTAEAVQHLERVFRLNPSPEVAEAAKRSLIPTYKYQQAKLPAQSNISVTGYVNLGAGYNSNANGSIDSDINNLPSYAEPAAKATSDYSLNTNAGAQLHNMLSPKLYWQTGISAGKQKYNQLEEFDNTTLAANTSLRYNNTKFDNNAAISFSHYQGEQVKQNNTGLSLRSTYALTPQLFLSGITSFTALRYNERYQAYNLNQLYLASNLGYKPTSGNSYHTIGLYIGKEQCTEAPARVDGDQDIIGTNVNSEFSLHQNLKANAALAYKSGKFSETNPDIKKTRADQQWDLSTGLSWNIYPNVWLQPSISYTKTNSNHILYKYNRTTANVNARIDLR